MNGDASTTGKSKNRLSSGNLYLAASCSVIRGSGSVIVPLYKVPLDKTLSKIPQLVVSADTTLAHSGALESIVIELLETGAIFEKKPGSKSFLIALMQSSLAYAKIARV